MELSGAALLERAALTVRRLVQGRRILRRLALAADALPVVLGYIDGAERFVCANRACSDWFQRPLARIDGRPAAEVLGEGVYARLRAPLAEALAGRRAAFEARAEDGGRERWLEGQLIPDMGPAGRPLGVVLFMMDVTEARRAAAERDAARDALARHAAGLERLVGERTAELREKMAELEAFSYTASHDLRAPLRALQGYSEMLLRRWPDLGGLEARGLLERLCASAERMDALVRDILAFASVGRPGGRLAAVDLDAVAGHVLSTYPALRQGVRLRQPLGAAMGCPSLLTLVLSNLLSNAVKFVPRDRAPEVEVWTERRGGRLRLVVADNGIGIDKEHQGRIFEPFARLHPRGTYAGTGIGLAIVRKAAAAMDGRVGVESEPGRGSRFWVELGEA